MSLMGAEKFSPTLFIGLGGSGGKVVDRLASKLRRHPHWDRFRDLVHIATLDTNKADLNALAHIPPANRFLLSAFDRRAYVSRKRGERELPADPHAVAWLHDNYQFREAQGAGAGQIRIESRLGLYYNLEDDRAGLRAAVLRMLDSAAKPNNPWRDNEDRVVQVFIYGSLAGGTGSGAALPFAYWLHDTIVDHGWGRPNIVGSLFLPSVFKSKIEVALHDDVDANAYAALKELEQAMRLGYEGCEESLHLCHDPMHRDRATVTHRPFSICYLVDKPGDLAIERYTEAVADASFLQVFSTLLGAQSSEYDNYDKHQKSLALGHFTVHFAAYGASLLVFPRRDLVHYAALRFASNALEKAILCRLEGSFRIDTSEPSFQRLAEDERKRRIDTAFRDAIQYGVQQEQDAPGMFTQIAKPRVEGASSVRHLFRSKLAAILASIDGAIELDVSNRCFGITEEAPNLAPVRDELKQQIADSRRRLNANVLPSILTDLKSGRFLDQVFGDNVPPLAQRYFLANLRTEESELQLSPTEDPNEGLFLAHTADNSSDLNRDDVLRSIEDMDRRLVAATQRGFIKSLLSSSENAAFMQAKRSAVAHLDSLAVGNYQSLQIEAWARIREELDGAITRRLDTLRAIAELAEQAVTQLNADANRFLTDPATDKAYDADVADYYLDIEALRDDKTGARLWDFAYDHLLSSPAYFETSSLAATVANCFRPKVGTDGRAKTLDPSEVLRELRAAFVSLGEERFAIALRSEHKVDLQRALDLEARYVAAGPRGALSLQAWCEKVDHADSAFISDYVRQKIRSTIDQCVLLAQLDSARFDDPTVKAADIFYAGLSPRFSTEEPTSLGHHIRAVEPKVDLVEGWDESDLAVFYRAKLGIPVYFMKRANEELARGYKKVQSRPNRSYPLHIDKRWETALPNLDPLELRKAEDRRRAELEANRAKDERTERARLFCLAALLGLVERDDANGYSWRLGGAKRALGTGRFSAFEAFFALDAGLRKDIEKQVTAAAPGIGASAADRRRWRERLESYQKVINDLYYAAIADENERDRAVLEIDRDYLELALANLPV